MSAIDDARRSDVPQLVSLLGHLFAQEQEFEPDCEAQERGLQLILDAPTAGRIFVARDGDRLVGMVSLLFTISTALGAPVCWLEDMVVHPDVRSRGLGTRLITHALAFAQAHGYARVSLLTDGANADARRFYARHGFAHSDMVAMRAHFVGARVGAKD